MKRSLLLVLFALPFILGACTKTVIEQPGNSNSIVGSWELLYAEKSNGYNSTSIYTGYEEGLFHFYGNGQAEYDDGYELMRGNWQMRRVNDGYRDAHGNYHSGSFTVFSLYLSNYNGTRIIEWDFDES